MNNKESQQYAQQLVKKLQEQGGYDAFKILEDGTVCALGKLLFTTALYMDLNEYGAEQRYCYPRGGRAVEALNALKSVDDIPLEGFIAYRGVDAAKKVEGSPEAKRAYECAKDAQEERVPVVKKQVSEPMVEGKSAPLSMKMK